VDETRAEKLLRQDNLRQDLRDLLREDFGAPAGMEDQIIRSWVWLGNALVLGHKGFLWLLGGGIVLAAGALAALAVSKGVG